MGDSVDVYLTTTNASTTTTSSNNTTTSTTSTATTSSPTISGATVLAILRAKDSGVLDANLEQSQEIAVNTLTLTTSQSQSATSNTGEGLEELLKAAASRTWDENQVSSLLDSYGWRLSDFERASNLGELDVRYMVVLEVPRENALFLMQNSQNLQLTVPTQSAPEWMVTEMKKIYGTG